MLSFSNIQTHAYRMKYEINFTTKICYCFFKKIFEIIHISHISADNQCIAALFSQFIYFTHSQCNRGIC